MLCNLAYFYYFQKPGNGDNFTISKVQNFLEYLLMDIVNIFL